MDKFIDIIFNISTFGTEPKISTIGMIRKENSNVKGASIASSLIVKINKEFKRYDTVMLIIAKAGLMKEFDQCISNSKGNIKFVLPNVKAEFYNGRSKDGSRKYKYVDVIFDESAEGKKFIKRFYLSDIQSELIDSGYFKPTYEFVNREVEVAEVDEEVDVLEG